MSTCLEHEQHIAALEAEAAAAAAEMHAATARLTAALGRSDEAAAWPGAGTVSIGHWAEINRARPAGGAARMARVARQLDALPELRGTYVEGALSYEKVAMVARVASAESDAKFTYMARTASVAQLRDICNAYRN